MAVQYDNGHDKNIEGAEIAKNSLVAVRNRLVAIKSGFADNATTWDTLVWISRQDKTYDSDNQTVKQELLNYIGLEVWITQFKSTVVGWTIAQANVGTVYDIDANWDVDVSLATPDQVKLVKVISTTEWVFVTAK